MYILDLKSTTIYICINSTRVLYIYLYRRGKKETEIDFDSDLREVDASHHHTSPYTLTYSRI